MSKKTNKSFKARKFHFTEYVTKNYFLNDVRFSHDFLNGVALDLSFQRHACWPLKQMMEYCTSVVLGNAPSPIVVVNIEKSLAKTIKNSPDYFYFKKWLDLGFKWISIDGNNRTVALQKFYKNEVSVIHGEYLLSIVETINSSNDTFRKLPESIKQRAYSDSQVSVVEYAVESRQDCSDLFLNINSGKDLNSQEKRNAKLTNIAGEIRDMGSNSIDKLKYIFGAKGNEGYQIDEMIARMSCIHAYGPNRGVSPKDLNESYEDNSTVWPQFISFGGKESIQKTIELIGKYGSQKFKNKATLLNLFMVVSTLHKENRKIINDESFFKWFNETEKKRLHKVAHKTSNGEVLLYETCNRNVNKINLTARFNLISEDVKTVPKNIVSIALDNKRIYSKQEKYQAWVNQNGICPLTGKNIPEDEIYDSEIWQAHHDIPYSFGGQTTQENCFLVDVKANQKLGNKYDFDKLAA